jgi:hypothetical protein
MTAFKTPFSTLFVSGLPPEVFSNRLLAYPVARLKHA